MTLARDAEGIAQGGIRLSDVAVPTALNHGENAVVSGSSFCALYGHWIPYTVARLNQLYPTHQGYVNAVIANVRANIRAGLVNRSDGRTIVAEAVDSDVGADTKPGTGGIDFDADPDFSGPDL